MSKAHRQDLNASNKERHSTVVKNPNAGSAEQKKNKNTPPAGKVKNSWSHILIALTMSCLLWMIPALLWLVVLLKPAAERSQNLCKIILKQLKYTKSKDKERHMILKWLTILTAKCNDKPQERPPLGQSSAPSPSEEAADHGRPEVVQIPARCLPWLQNQG